ncbi:GNAT family N-acetyltransferase [Rickettsiales endosymbiont of Stachyamoeba lipophora]|uniref:GNAT family N-acetyltransferase n=1 Tax=Rickettsiales endosymbiont of Stachyamoeba lipophora TaxID=2486578 RepID=UPI000F64C5EB|nr:GNAT family protein [Rickettsiales endosymbiont of Stachyamoeba lipophora]AZL15086.1 N-acetyltransferase [Rickettsiales endosymbiont of Stachyamoeba lipophora]
MLFHSADKNNFPSLNINKDIILREIIIDDAIYYHEYINHPLVKKYLSDEDIPETFEKAINELRYWQALFRDQHSIYWAIALKESNKMIGTIGFNNWYKFHERLEISYDLDPEFWGQGITTVAITQVCNYAQQRMSAKRIQATVALDNVASTRVLEKNNFHLEGILKNYAKLGNLQNDFYMYSKVF